MKTLSFLTAGASMVALALLAPGASANQIFYPHRLDARHAAANGLMMHAHNAPFIAPKKNKSGTWTDVSTNLPFANGPWGSMLLTDGTVIILDYFTTPAQWYKLTPDNKGQYSDGAWSKIAPMPSGYSPFYFAQQVLPDGRVIISGGEYDDYTLNWENKGALYDPLTDSWTSVAAPAGWSTIGDSQSVILPNGDYMIANCCDSPGEAALAAISGSTVTWTVQQTVSCGNRGSRYGCNGEEEWTSLPAGEVLTVDIWNTGSNYNDYEIYDSTTGSWSIAGKTANLLSNDSPEIGPAPLTPAAGKYGSVFQFGADQYNDVYDVAGEDWKQGPSFPLSGYDCADAPAATLPDGNILVQASPGEFKTPSHFFEVSFDKKGASRIVQVNDSAQAAVTSSFEGAMLLVPSGQVLWVNSQASPKEVALYTPQGNAKSEWLPVVSDVAGALKTGSKGNAISGVNFNGFDLGAMYGDDAQQATNYPIVRITNNATGDVCFGRSYDFSTMGVWTTGATNAAFDIPKSCETGVSTLQVIVNGIASAGVSVKLKR